MSQRGRLVKSDAKSNSSKAKTAIYFDSAEPCHYHARPCRQDPFQIV